MTFYRSSCAAVHIVFFLIILLTLLPTETYAFGAGSIPEYSYLHEKAFHHGDIGHILEKIARSPHSHTGGDGGIFNLFSALATMGLNAVLQGDVATKFSKKDIQRVYFGNWLRDYSQAIDVAGLSKMHFDSLLTIVQFLGFMSFGYATREYEITPERLGVYLPVEHIDNPKGYADKEGDARNYHPKLRPPVDPRELEIDSRTGMKKYMATEGQSWDTSTAHIRKVLKECIELGREVHNNESFDALEDAEENPDMWVALRLLGSALHTLEDLLAHSNWCEIALVKLGYRDVFCHVGDQVRIRTPNGTAPPLVTGTFGSLDFLHSLLGGASDHFHTASVFDLTQHMSSDGSGEALSSLRSLISGLPEFLNPSEKNSTAEAIEARANEYKQRYEKAEAKRTKRLSPEVALNEDDGEQLDGYEDDLPPESEMQSFIWEVLLWRDEIVRGISGAIEKIPGLTTLLEQITGVINQCVFTLLAPILLPIISEVTLALKEESQAIIDTEDQYEVFDNPRASDPTHSVIAKDHVDLILNEPAGKISQVVVEHTVNLIVRAWYEPRDNADRVIDKILEAFHHPYFATGRSKVQNDMISCLKDWVESFGEDKMVVIDALTKQSIRDGTNKRIAGLGHGYSDDTLSSLEGSDYGSVYDYSSAPSERNNAPTPNTSGIGTAYTRVRLPPGGNRSFANRDQEQYEDILRDPRASPESKRYARSQLPREQLTHNRDVQSGINLAGPSTSRVDVYSDGTNGYKSDASSEFSSLSDSFHIPLGGPSRETARQREERRRSQREGVQNVGQTSNSRGTRVNRRGSAQDEETTGRQDTDRRGHARKQSWWDPSSWL